MELAQEPAQIKLFSAFGSVVLGGGGERCVRYVVVTARWMLDEMCFECVCGCEWEVGVWLWMSGERCCGCGYVAVVCGLRTKSYFV